MTGVAFLTGGIQNVCFWLLQTFPGLAIWAEAQSETSQA